jgi:rare lipoprotein A
VQISTFGSEGALQFPRIPAARLRQRRLFQGCAILLLIPTTAAFLPVQGRAPQKTLALVPVNPKPISLPALSAKPVAQVTAHIPTVPAKKASRLAGLASWYGNVLRGHHTASGEIFNPDELTACHPTLPFGTIVKVINLINHRTVTVRITDRGVLNPNRVIDLSSAAAVQLDMLRAGVAPVRLEVQSMLHGKPTVPAATQPQTTQAVPAAQAEIPADK